MPQGLPEALVHGSDAEPQPCADNQPDAAAHRGTDERAFTSPNAGALASPDTRAEPCTVAITNSCALTGAYADTDERAFGGTNCEPDARAEPRADERAFGGTNCEPDARAEPRADKRALCSPNYEPDATTNKCTDLGTDAITDASPVRCRPHARMRQVAVWHLLSERGQ